MTLLSTAITFMRETQARAARNRRYYAGDFPSVFSSETDFTNPARRLIDGICDNQCKGVIDLTIDRLQVNGFATTSPNDVVQEALSARAFDLWQENRMSLASRNFFTSLEVTGEEGAIIVYPDSSGRVRLWVQEPEQIAFERSPQNRETLVWIAKKFWDTNASVIIVYTADVVQTWRSNSTLVDPDESTYRLVSEEPHPFGFVPAVAVGMQGCSDIDLAAPLNEMLNQALANSAIASQFFSLPLRVVTGLEVEIDPETGHKVPPFKIGLERTLFLPGAMQGEQPIGVEQLSGEAPTALLAEADSHRRAIAAVTRTPVHLLLQSGSFPSGESLRTAEAPFIAKVKGRMDVYGSALADALSIAVVIDAFLKTGIILPRPDLVTTWAPAGSESLESNSRVVETLVSVGVPLEIALVKVMGWDSETATFVAEKSREEAQLRNSMTAMRLDAGL
jgi:hypothetical protein